MLVHVGLKSSFEQGKHARMMDIYRNEALFKLTLVRNHERIMDLLPGILSQGLWVAGEAQQA